MNWKVTAVVLVLALTFLLIGYENKDNDKEIRALSDENMKAFNEHDAEKLARLWSEDGFLENLNTHVSIQGRENLIKFFKTYFENTPESTINISIKEIHFVDPEQAIEKGMAQIHYKDNTVENAAFKMESIKADGVWKIQNLSLFYATPTHSNYEHLKELEWLIGDWVDQDEDTDTHLSYRWDENKNWIFQNYEMAILGQEYLKGYQIIGWDPIKKKIHSWIFDSEGGFGECIWSKENDKWFANTGFTFSDGKKGSSLHIYKKINDNSYTFSSQARDINGIIQPNIGPFTVVRKLSEEQQHEENQ